MESTVVGLFGQESEADAARNELLSAGFSERDLSVFTELSLGESVEGLAERISSWFGHSPEPEVRTFVTVYGPSQRIDKAERILRNHQPRDVKKHTEAPQQVHRRFVA